MNLITAITILNEGRLLGPNGCPILYMKDEDNPDQMQALKTEEFFKYLIKNNIFRNVSSYCNTSFYLSWFYMDNGKELTNSDVKSLQDMYSLDKLKTNEDIHDSLVWSIIREGLEYIWGASFPNEDFPMEFFGSLTNDIDQIYNIYNKVKEKFLDKLDVSTFIQAVNSKLQKREKWNLTSENINYVINYLTTILTDKNYGSL